MAVALPYIAAAAATYSAYTGAETARNAQDNAKKQLAQQQAALDAQAKQVMPTQDSDAVALAQRRTLSSLQQRQGRASTILSDQGSQTLGG